MYNHELNEQWVEKLRTAVAGKKILMVGNATTMFSKKFGSLIDGYDFVVRFGKGVPMHEFREYLGTKTDLWFFGMGRAGMHKHFVNAPFKVLTLSQLSLYKENRTELSFHEDMASGALQPYRDFFLAGSSGETLDCNREINPDAADARLSQGVQCIHWFNTKIKTQASIDLIGFDFFGAGFQYDYNTEKKHIPKHQPTTSWHCPLVAHHYDGNPHNKNGNEERYIRSVPGLTVHQMPPVNLARMEKVLKRLRGGKAVITGELQ